MTRLLGAGSAALLACAVVLAACSPAASSASGASAQSSSRAGSGSASVPSGSSTVWLCEPGHSPDPCTASLDATSVSGTGAETYQAASPAKSPKADCFYVYPTVSSEKTINSDLRIQPAEISAAEEQASRFSTVCRVYAPMYRQVTVAGLTAGDAVRRKYVNIALSSLESAFADYLNHDNHGRPIVFIGHSQGAAMLILLLEQRVDSSPSLLHRMLSAIILGGNVEVPTGKVVGASFKNIPACTRAGELHCVIAYSSFLEQPPSDAFFAIPGQGVSLQSFQRGRKGLQVVCTDPAGLALESGVGAPLSPYFRGAATGLHASSWLTYPGLYKGACESKDGATWLQVTPTPAAGDTRPIVTESLGPTWGLHLYDVNISLGDLVADVQAEIAAYPG